MTLSVANLPCPPIHGRSFGRFGESTDLVECGGLVQCWGFGNMGVTMRNGGSLAEHNSCIESAFWSNVSSFAHRSNSGPVHSAPPKLDQSLPSVQGNICEWIIAGRGRRPIASASV